MRILLRVLPYVVFIWLICYFFYSLGRKRALGDQKRKCESPPTKRKRVDSSVVENDSKWTSTRAIMWHTNCGDRTLEGAKARLFALIWRNERLQDVWVLFKTWRRKEVVFASKELFWRAVEWHPSAQDDWRIFLKYWPTRKRYRASQPPWEDP